MRKAFCYFMLLFFCCLTNISQAQTSNWTFNLTNSEQIGLPGSELVFNGMITNSTGSDLFLTSIGVDFTPDAPSSAYTYDFTDEFLNTSGIIPSSGYNGSVFYVRWDASVPLNTVGDGSVTLFADIPAQPESISMAFRASVVPAPSAVATFLIGTIPGLAMLMRRYRK